MACIRFNLALRETHYVLNIFVTIISLTRTLTRILCFIEYKKDKTCNSFPHCIDMHRRIFTLTYVHFVVFRCWCIKKEEDCVLTFWILSFVSVPLYFSCFSTRTIIRIESICYICRYVRIWFHIDIENLCIYIPRFLYVYAHKERETFSTFGIKT